MSGVVRAPKWFMKKIDFCAIAYRAKTHVFYCVSWKGYISTWNRRFRRVRPVDFFGSCVVFREQTSLRSLIHFGPCGAVGDGARAANSCRWDGHRCGPRGRPAATGGGFSRWIFLGRLELQILIYLEGREKSTTKNPPRPKTVEKKSTATKNTTQNTPTFRFLVAAQLEAFHSYACERCGAHPRT